MSGGATDRAQTGRAGASAERARAALATVMDPELPVVSIVDLGLVERVEVADGVIEVDLLPTFAGCPALEVIRGDAERALRALDPGARVHVRFVTSTPWTTDRMSEAGRAALGDYGVTPPLLQIGAKPAPCPYCGSTDTREDSAFGPTLCRSIRYCAACRNPYEAFKRKASPPEPAPHIVT